MNERPTPADDPQDAAVDAAWRRSSHEEPPAAVDDAIRAAARRRVGPHLRDERRAGEPSTTPRPWTRWTPVAAAAGVAVLAFGLLRWLPIAQQGPAPASVSAPSEIESASDAAGREPAGARTDAAPLAGESASATVDSPTSVRSSADFAARQKQMETVPSRERREAPSVSPSNAVAAPPPPAPLPAPATAPAKSAAHDQASVSMSTNHVAIPEQTDTSVPTGQTRVEKITELYEAGRLDDAAAELRELRKTDPHADARLPTQLHSWAASVRN